MTQSKARADFIRLINPRINAAIEKIRIIGNLAEPERYEYTENDIQIINEAISEARNECLERFASKGKTGRVFICDEPLPADGVENTPPITIVEACGNLATDGKKPSVGKTKSAETPMFAEDGLVDADFEEVA